MGAGAVGHVLAHRLMDCGYAVTAVLSRHRGDAVALAEAVGASVGSEALEDLPFTVPLVLLCVPDDSITPVAQRLAALERPWDTMTVAHTSGVQTADALAPVAARGASTLSLHPMQTFTRDSPPAIFANIYVGLEGDTEAVARGTRFVEDLGAHAITIPAAAKPQYHLAGVLASNGLVALMGLVREVLASAGLHPDKTSALVGPLVERSWANLAVSSPEDVLTGPAARGDRGTVAEHLDALATHLPHLLPAYAALTNEMVRLAVRSGQLDETRAEPVLDTLHNALHRYQDEKKT